MMSHKGGEGRGGCVISHKGGEECMMIPTGLGRGGVCDEPHMCIFNL